MSGAAETGWREEPTDRQESTNTKAAVLEHRLTKWSRYLANNRTSVAFTLLLVAIHAALMGARIYQYRESCVWVIVARATGQCLHFDCSLVLLLTLRKSITWLRNVRMDWLLPLDRHVYFHKMVGWTICILSVVHTAAHVINFGFLGKETGMSLATYLFDTSLDIGWFEGLANPSGVAVLIILAIMAVFSHRIVRKSGHFEIFYWTHLLCIPFFTLLVLHGPNVWKWIVGPLIVFSLEVACRLLLVCSGRGRSIITSITILPNQVIKLRIERPADFEFQPGDYVYANIPKIARWEWHPFTISSAPEHEGYLTLHVRVAGGWTGRLYEMFEADVANRWLRFVQRDADKKGILPISAQFSMATQPLKTSDSLAASWIETISSEKGRDNPAFQPDHSIVQVSTEAPTNQTFSNCQLTQLEVPIYLDGPYNGSSGRVWNCRHVLLIAGGIGVTPFASLLQSLVARYHSSIRDFHHYGQRCCTTLPRSLGKLQHVDFMWINRDLLSFQWFLELLLDLDRDPVNTASGDKFLDIQLYQTGSKRWPDANNPLWCNNCRLVGSAPESNLFAESPRSEGCRCVITLQQVQHLLRYGRPLWDEVFSRIASQRRGRVTVFYCGPPAMGRVILAKCQKFGFGFSKEVS